MTADRVLMNCDATAKQRLKGTNHPTATWPTICNARRGRRRDIDWIVGALLHDIGDGLASKTMTGFPQKLFAPFVRWEARG